QDFIAEQRPDHAASLARKLTPIGAELVGHDHAGNDAHAERERENFHPEQIEVLEQRFLGEKPKPLKHRKKRREPNREGWKNDVKAERESELQSRQQQRVKIHR